MRKALVVGCLLLTGCAKAPEQRPAPAATPQAATAASVGDPVEGLRVATRVGCNGCHGKNAAGEVFMENAEVGRVVAPNLTERRHKYDDAALAALAA